MKGKDEAAALVAVLQSTNDSEARSSACEAVLQLTKSDATCAGPHAPPALATPPRAI